MTKEEFELLPDNEKRIAIAKDVLLQLNLKNIVPLTGNYFESVRIDRIVSKLMPEQTLSLQQLLPESKCEVCALGALFFADVLQTNQFQVSSNKKIVEKTDMLVKLNYFSEEQLNLIECAFECTDFYRTGNFPTFFNRCMARDFGKKYSYSANRMKAIMQNIIENDGTFIP